MFMKGKREFIYSVKEFSVINQQILLRPKGIYLEINRQKKKKTPRTRVGVLLRPVTYGDAADEKVKLYRDMSLDTWPYRVDVLQRLKASSSSLLSVLKYI